MDTFEDYGTCCVCESEMEICFIIQLDYKVESESGWGCVKCGLSPQGAIALVCSDCVDKFGEGIEDQIKHLMDGKKGRLPVPPVEKRIPHGHDLSLHPKYTEEES